MKSENEIPVRILTEQEKDFVKSELLKVTSLLQYWQNEYNKAFKLEKDISIAEIKKKILDGSLEEKFPDISLAKKLLKSFSNDYVESINGTLEFVITCSFAAKCKGIAKNRAKKLSAELNMDAQSIYEDLLQDAYASVVHSIYYFTRQDLALSTFVLGSLARSIERCSRYRYSKFSPMSNEDTISSYKCRVVQMENPHFTLEEIAEELEMETDKASEILCSMAPVVRLCGSSHSLNESETSFNVLEQVPDRTSSIEEADNIDTVEFLKSIFDDVDESILTFTREEKDVLRAACSSNFERGWQSNFARVYINQTTGKPYSRARIGQIFNSAIEKVRFFLEAA